MMLMMMKLWMRFPLKNQLIIGAQRIDTTMNNMEYIKTNVSKLPKAKIKIFSHNNIDKQKRKLIYSVN